MSNEKGLARVIGVSFIIATAAAVIGDRLLRPIRDDSDYLDNFSTHETRVIIGVLTEVILAVSVVAIAVLFLPILKRQNEVAAQFYIGVRILEGMVILVGAMSSLLLLSLSKDYIATGSLDSSGFDVSGSVVLAAREWTDSLGPAIVFALSALILYSTLYASRLVPRFLSVWGFVGAVMLLVAGVGGLYGESPTSARSIALTAPIGINEMVLALWLIIRGFDLRGPDTESVTDRCEATPSLDLTRIS
ncbi:MAG: DUF4386 domain-containing protein [Actinomycetia bacterium]|nr:DUF4386 domain-containing protein [Actinomycetes bacterium]